MKRYAVVYTMPSGLAGMFTTDAVDESDARRQFYELYEGRGFEIKCVAQI